MHQLFNQGQINEPIVGLNFEDPKEKSLISSIHFGYIDYSEIKGGKEGLVYFSNIGLSLWGTIMHSVGYGNESMTISHDTDGKLAVIDSGNTSIQIPASQFDKLMERMLQDDKSITKQDIEGAGTIMVSTKSCRDLESIYKPLVFHLDKAEITIKPQGYLFNLPMQDDCFIGIQSIPDRANQYRLGTTFLRNFYTALDYDKDIIMLGLNNDGVTSTLKGPPHVIPNPTGPDTPTYIPPTPNSSAWIIILVILLVMFALGIGFYLRARHQEKQRTVTFSHEDGDGRKVYRNGVEANPSELAKEKAQRHVINESLEESLD